MRVVQVSKQSNKSTLDSIIDSISSLCDMIKENGLLNIANSLLIDTFFDIDYESVFRIPRIPPVKDTYGCEIGEEYDNIIDYFNDFITKRMPGFDPSIFYKNYPTLKVLLKEKKDMNRNKLFAIKKRAKVGYYDSNTNSIVSSDEMIDDVIWHELLHVSSFIRCRNETHCGFCVRRNDSVPIGNGINEGYTELLNERYFTPNYNRHSYNIERKYMHIIEYIVGQSNLINMYSSANLEGFIRHLEQFIDRRSIITFIHNLDFITITKDNKNDLINKSIRSCYKQCNDFIIRLIYNYSYYLLSNKSISQREYDKLNEFLMNMLIDTEGIRNFEKNIGVKSISDFSALLRSSKNGYGNNVISLKNRLK